ncbi:MAG: hypothetical protein Q8K33_01650 [Cypionkella sp.]|uniref:hypothetical protein n=1 Tax=Cypionkella sp. TaxID=2811411 RepID=UPI002731DBA1|nr:hypothetical protein [Cypionkella sp.]MDP2047586.1 hypothetical protein [Cypionkella sp.]
MTPETCVQTIYRNWLVDDARAIRLRLNAEKALMRVQEREIEDHDAPRAMLIDAMLRVISTTTPSSLEQVIDRVVGLNPETAKKHMLVLLQRGLVKEAGVERAASGQKRKLWLRVMP